MNKKSMNAVDLLLRPIGKVEIEKQSGRTPCLRVAKVEEIVKALDQRGVVVVTHHLDAGALAGALTTIDHEIFIPCAVVLRRGGTVLILLISVFRAILRDLGELPTYGEAHGMMIFR